MKDLKGFLKIKREKCEYRPVCERVKDYFEVSRLRPENKSREQASRCMDCGTPFCHWGCPIGNYIPEWNELMFLRQWERAWQLLDATNPLPEVTGRVCPAPCEYACVLGINDDPVTIRENELSVVEHAFKKGFVKPQLPRSRTGRRVAIIGSGPAGLAAAVKLNRMGHSVIVFERDEKIGGIMRFGIPDFKLGKSVLDRRIVIWQKEGIEFRTNADVGTDISVLKLKAEFDAILLACGSRVPRDLAIEGRGLKGIHFALDYLIQSNRRVAGAKIPSDKLIDAKGKKVVVIGGGDTGADCVGTAHRQGAQCVVQIEILPKPSEQRPAEQPWPKYPNVFKRSTSHEEGGVREWSVMTKRFIGEGHVKKLLCTRLDYTSGGMKEIPGSAFEIEADLVILAMGFLGPERKGVIEELGIELDDRGNVRTDKNYMTSVNGVFSAGDMRRGQSLIVWAIFEGIVAAENIGEYLKKKN